MPAGDLVTGNWQVELRGVLMGDSTSYDIDRRRGAIGGLFDQAVTFAETPYAHADGAFIGESFAGPRTVSVALEVVGATEAAAGTNLATMRTTWAAGAVEEQLWFQVPGIGKGYVVGWPAGLVVDYTTPDFGLIPCMASFRLADPTVYTP